MAPKGGNAKEAGRRSKKSDKKAPEKATSAPETKEPIDKREAKKREQEEKRAKDLERKAENRSLAEKEESESVPKAKPTVRKKGKETTKPAGPGAIAAGADLGGEPEKDVEPEKVESYSATGLDNALDLMTIVTAKTDKASVGQQAAGLERHPERRFKAAFEAYQERELPSMKTEHPGLRLQQYKDLLFKQFQKAPENPYNQTVVDYDATKDERVEALKVKRAQVEVRLRDET